MKNFLFTVCLSLILTACGGAESEAKKVVLDILKDPDSAKFGEFTQVNEKKACLTVNARNSMGGYTGDQQAFLTKYEEGWSAFIIDTSQERCIDMQRRNPEESE